MIFKNTSVLFIILMLSFSVNAKEPLLRIVIDPPKNAPNATACSKPGFDWKTCRPEHGAEPVGWPARGSVYKATLISKTNGKSKNQKLNKYYEIEIQSPNGEKEIGYIPEEYAKKIEVKEPARTKNCQKKGSASQVIPIIDKSLDIPKPKDSKFYIGILDNPQVINPKCKNFMDENGSLGPWGQKVLNAMDSVDRGCFYESHDLLQIASICPNFSHFDEKTKGKWWVFAFTCLAQDESSCDPNEDNPNAKNGVGYGLLMMESLSFRRDHGRDEKFCATKRNVNPKNIDFNIQCSASIFRDQYCHKRRPLTSRAGYWAKLIGDRTVARRLRLFPGCYK